MSAEPDTARVSAPAHRVVLAAVTDGALDVAAHAAACADRAAGATVTFAGVVRDHDGGRPVQRLTYVGHPTASRVLAEVAADVAARHPVDALAVSHRLGDLEVGDVALAVAVSAAHRGEAFTAAAALVDEVKARLPVWKHQVLDDGSDEWVACP